MNKQRGFTLIELLLAMALMGGFIIVLTSIFSAAVSVQSESQAASSVDQDGRFILSRLHYDISRADSISTPAALGASGSQLTLVIGGVANTYVLGSGNLQLTNDTGTSALNGSETSLSNLSVQRLGNSGGKETIRLSFTITSKARDNQGTRAQTFTMTAGRR